MLKSIFRLLTIFTLTTSLTSCAQTDKTNENKPIMENYNLEKALVANGYVKIPLTKEISGHLQLNGSINGVKGTFILDTGAGATVIEQTQKEKFKITSIKTDDTATGAGGADIAMEDSENNEIILSGFKLENRFLTLMDLGYINDAFESLGIQKTDGVIGADVLTDGKAIIDYFNLVLYLKK